MTLAPSLRCGMAVLLLGSFAFRPALAPAWVARPPVGADEGPGAVAVPAPGVGWALGRAGSVGRPDPVPVGWSAAASWRTSDLLGSTGPHWMSNPFSRLVPATGSAQTGGGIGARELGVGIDGCEGSRHGYGRGEGTLGGAPSGRASARRGLPVHASRGADLSVRPPRLNTQPGRPRAEWASRYRGTGDHRTGRCPCPLPCRRNAPEPALLLAHPSRQKLEIPSRSPSVTSGQLWLPL